MPRTEPHEFIPVDEYGRVAGLRGVYAAGDAVDFPVKQGGLAAQQADVVAEHVAARYGAGRRIGAVSLRCCEECCSPATSRSTCARACPVSTRDVPGAWYPLWWPPTKVAGRYLGPYLSEHGDEGRFGAPPVGFVDIDVPLAALTMPG